MNLEKEHEKEPDNAPRSSFWKNFDLKSIKAATMKAVPTKGDESPNKPLPKMRLEPVHQFHTNPAISHAVHSKKDTAAANSPNSKSPSRKEKTNQTKNDPSNSTGNNNLSSNCSIAVWAPNDNHCKNVELLAIASPISLGVHSTASGNPTGKSESHLFILVFDETTFSHSMEFTVASEISDLFGLPPQRMPNRRKLPIDCGLRRPVFVNQALTKDDDEEFKRDDPNVVSPSNPIQEQTQNAYTKAIKPFIGHIKDEVLNTIHLMRYELFDDGRLLGLSNTSFVVKGQKEEETIGADDGEARERLDNEQYSEDSKSENGDTKSPCPIKPQLVFQIRLPYNSSSMEVTNLEWNADGTALSIIQKRKGPSNAFSAVSNANVTNKKKKSTAIPLSPAVSFWSVPEWLLAETENMKMCHEEDELNYETDVSSVKANLIQETSCGWEVEDDQENRTLFPLWEWYLGKYVFKDEITSNDALLDQEKNTRISMTNCIRSSAYTMELSSSCQASSNSRKKTQKMRGSLPAASSDSSTSVMSGDITCLIWEEPQPKDNSEKENLSSNVISPKPKSKIASKWVAICTSKGQITLHNSSTSYLLHQCEKHSRRNGAGFKNAITNVLNNLPSHGRSVMVPSRHKKRVTCGVWVDNLLIVGNFGTGSISIFSTTKRDLSTELPMESFPKQIKNIPALDERVVKVLGNIPLPGGKDAVQISFGNVDDTGRISVLSVNCEGKSLLFYTFPRDPNALTTNITNAQATEINFSMHISTIGASSVLSTPKTTPRGCGSIIFYTLIPNTVLSIVAFSNGYIALINWKKGIVLSVADVLTYSLNVSADNDSNFEDRNSELIDAAYHHQTNTMACLTQSGHLLVFLVVLMDDIPNGPQNTSETELQITTKLHNPPKLSSTPSSSVEENLSTMKSIGEIKFICTHRIRHVPAIQLDCRKGEPSLLNFSCDGECISVSLADESVQLFSIIVDDKQAETLKQKLAECVYHGRDAIFMMLMVFLSIVIVYYEGTKRVGFMSMKNN